MRGLRQRIDERLKQLGTNRSRVARRLGLSSQRFGQYVNEDHEPDLELTVKIAAALEVTVGQLLGAEPMPPPPGHDDPRAAWLEDLATTVRHLSDDEVRMLVTGLKAALQSRTGLQR